MSESQHRKKEFYVCANWKMYLNYTESIDFAHALSKNFLPVSSSIKMVIFPSALAFVGVEHVLRTTPIFVGTQNVCWVEKGAYTGEVSAEMYKAAGASYALVGHSERRHIFKETNHEVRQKIETVLGVGLTPIVCVGETRAERTDGQTEKVIEIQLRAAFEDLVCSATQEFIIAYEPVWAVNTGEACEPKEAERMHMLIQDMVNKLLPKNPTFILYGGSVRAENVGAYYNQEHIDGILVGGASVKLVSWLEIIGQINT